MNTRNWIIVHSTGSLAAPEKEQFDAVYRYHRETKGWGMIAYHWFIEYSGMIRVGRPENASGAHCFQWMMNFRSIGVCLAGNFDKQTPSDAQLRALASLLTDIQLRNGIANGKVKLHREFASYKTCPGTLFPRKTLDDILFTRGIRGDKIPEPLPDLHPTHE